MVAGGGESWSMAKWVGGLTEGRDEAFHRVERGDGFPAHADTGTEQRVSTSSYVSYTQESYFKKCQL